MAITLSPKRTIKQRSRRNKSTELFEHDTRTGWMFLAPFVLGLMAFTVIPIFMAVAI